MSVTVRKEGIFTTVQDLGRVGFRKEGINPSGVMDCTAARLLNVLLGNDENAALLEMHFPAGEIFFDHPTIFAIGGADFGASLNDVQIQNWKCTSAPAGSSLRFSTKVSGERLYLAAQRGFSVSEWLGSKSTNLTAAFGGFNGRRLRTGDVVATIDDSSQPTIHRHSFISSSLIPRYSTFPTVRVIAGAEYDRLSAASQQAFLKETFTVSSNSDRMGFRLQGKPLHLLEPDEMISSPVNFGTIQLLPDGQLIVLMADHQTSGGYPRVANVIERDLSLLAQLGPKNKVAFHEVGIDHAEELMLEFERDLALLKAGVKLSAG